MKSYRTKVLFALSFGLGLGVGLFLLSLISQPVFAANLNINACVPTTELCNNSVDDDCDDDIDCNDADCSNAVVCGIPTSFPAGTLITMADGGVRPIETLVVGDEILSFDLVASRLVSGTVVRNHTRVVPGYLIINSLRVTSEHPLYVKGEWMLAREVALGDTILRLDGSIEAIYNLREEQQPTRVYNLTAAGEHNFYADGYLVHNKGESFCGDGVANQLSEECDDGDVDAADQCDTFGSNPDSNGVCTWTFCGDGTQQEPNGDGEQEQCDGTDGVPFGYSCSPTCTLLAPNCGNGGPDAGEECDDGNADPADLCDTTGLNPDGNGLCTLTFCGDGELQNPNGQNASEQCDPPGSNGCQPGCVQGLEIIGHTHFPSSNEALVAWTTNLPSDSTIEWGLRTGPVCDYGVDLNQSLYVPTNDVGHEILLQNLLPGRTYCYRITSATTYLGNPLSDSSVDFFLTTGAPPNPEICDNLIDDDGDLLVDIEDQDCPCQATWVYDPANWDAVECINGQQTRGYEKERINGLRCWSNLPPPEAVRDCAGECSGVVCPPNHTVDQNSCVCVPISGVCGNLICDPGDLCGCPSDCSNECVPNWQCDPETLDQAQCVNGEQTIICLDIGGPNGQGCNTTECMPQTQQSCTPGCSQQCFDWQELDIASCTCINKSPYCPNQICEDGEDYLTCPQDCVPPCTPAWIPTEWSDCVNGIQTRSYQDANQCPDPVNPPPNTRCCGSGCNVACGVCQRLDLESQSCIALADCCGNASCEQPDENVYTCAVDCGIPPGREETFPECLDGLDNDGDGKVDYPADSGCPEPADDSEYTLVELFTDISDFFNRYFFNNPTAEAITKTGSPLLAVAALVNTFATFAFVNFLSYLRFLFTQPFAVLFRRRRKKWGVVYNALSKQPIDLAIVRIYKQSNGQLVQSRVTDKEGRYSFLVDAGQYYLTVTKPKFSFPSQYLQGRKEDTKFLDLYHGQTIEVTSQAGPITANIPIDPADQAERPALKIVLAHYLRKLQAGAAFAAVPLAAAAAAIAPSPFTFTMFGVHVLLFALFRRLGYQPRPKSWGVVYDRANRNPVGQAITRIYDKEYNKLLETRMTSAGGHYAFLVDKNTYYVTAEKLGYHQTKTEPINLAANEREAFVGMDIGLERGKAEKSAVSQSIPQPTPATVQSTQPVQPAARTDRSVDASKDQQPKTNNKKLIPTSGPGVGRESLERIMRERQTESAPAEPNAEPKPAPKPESVQTKTPPSPKPPQTPPSIYG